MKRNLIVFLLIVGGSTLGLFLFSRHHVPVANPVAPPISQATPAAKVIAASPVHSALLSSNSVVGTPVSSPRVASPVEAIAATAAMDDFAKWAGQFNPAANLVEGQRLAWKRREAMLELIQTDPAKALSLAVPFAWRQQLPSQITRFFEQQLDGRGDFNVAVATDFKQASTATFRSVDLNGTNYQAFVYGRRLVQSCQTKVPLHGIALDGKMALSSDALRALTEAEANSLAKDRRHPLDKICSVSSLSATARNQIVYADAGGGILCFCGTDHYELVNQQWALAASGGTAGAGGSGVAGVGAPVNDAWTHGTKSLLYIRLNFPDDLTEPISEGDAYLAMQGVNSFYTAVSYDLTALDTTVTPLITLPQTKAYYSADPGLLLTDARAVAKQAGYDTANYDRDIVAFTSVPNYDFGGLAFVGGKGVWLQSMGSGVTAHELGHNYGLWHANFWNTTTNLSMIGPGTNLEYGNIYDTMGLAGAGIYQFDAPHKNKLDWLKADAVQTITTNGVYRIYPLDVPAGSRVPGRYYAAAVQKDALRYYWLEFRQLFASNPWLQNGLLVNWAPWPESSGGTQLIDTTPGSPDAGDANSRSDAAVVIGRTFNDNVGGVHVTPLQRGSTGNAPWIECQVNLGAFPGNHPPALTVEVDHTNVPSGDLVHFHATATDADGDTLAYAWSFDDRKFSTNNLPWTSKVYTNSGEHVVRCVVSDMKGGVASANAVVTVGSTTGFRITGRVTDTNGLPLEGVLVGNGLIDPADFVGGWTDSDGRYVLVNISGDASFDLNAFQFGYTFTTASVSNPTNDTSGIDFAGTPLPTVKISVDTNAVAETDGSAHYFTITRTGDTNTDLSVNIILSGTATLDTDYTLDLDPPITNVIIIPAGSNYITIPFHARNDSLVEGPETATLTLLDDQNFTSPVYVLAPLAQATITILDDDQPVVPAVTVTTTTPVISENWIDNGEFVFTRNGSAQNDLLVNYSVGGTATSGADFAPLAGVVLIPAGQNSATVLLQPLDDHAVETNETVVVTLLPSGAYSTASPSTATLTIVDDGANTVTVAPIFQPAAEPSGSGTFVIQRDGDLTDALIVNYTVGGTAVPGVDYASMSGTATIPAGATAVAVSFTALQDGLLAPDKYVTLILTNDFNYDIGTPGSASIYITQSERPTVFVSALTDSISEQGDAFGQFQILRTTTTGDLAVYLAISGTATPGVDYLPLDNPVIIPDGSSSVTLDVIPFQDLIAEPTENIVLTLLANTNYNLSTPGSASMDLLDDGTSQTPGVGFCFATSSIVESQSPGIAVSLSTTSSSPVQVDYRVIGGTAPATRYTLAQGTLTISNGLVDFVPLAIVNDAVVEPPQTVKVVLFNPINATLDGIKVHTYTILDDDLSSVSVAATVPSASEIGPVPGNFRITRTGSTNTSQLVYFQVTGTASAPSDYAPLGSSVTIPPGAQFVDLPVVPVDDHTTELLQTVVLTLTSATNGAIIAPKVATVRITDNDTNPLPVVSVTSTNQPYAIEGGSNGAFVFTRTGPTDSALTVSFTRTGTAALARFTALPGSISIPIGQTSATLPVVAVDDSAVQGEQTVIVSLTEGETYRSAFPSSATVTIQDNEQRVWIDASDFQASKYQTNSGEFTFSRFGTTNTPVTISYAISGTASNGVDYLRITNFAIIPAGQITVTLPIIPLHNGLVKGPTTATLTLLSNAAYSLGAPTNATVTIDDDMPSVFITTIVDSVLEGTGSNGVFRVTRSGDPQYDFTAHLLAGGVATPDVDYPAFPADIYFTCGVTSIDLFITPTNEVAVEGDESVTATLLPDPAYTVLSPSNAVLTIADAGTNQTPFVLITSPASYVTFLDGTNAGIILNATVFDSSSTDSVLWAEISGPPGAVFDDPTATNTGVLFTNSGAYLLRLTADNGFLQGHADILVFVSAATLSQSNILHWPLDDGAGTNVADTSSNGRNGSLVGQPAWITNGAIAGGLKFFGTNDCVRQTAGSNTLNGRKAFTVALWVYPPPTNASQGIVAGDDSGTNETFSLATRVYASCGSATNVVEAVVPASGGAVHRASASNALKPGQWQHIALTWTNGEAPKLYLNGQLDQPQAGFTPASGVLTNSPQFIVGKGSADSPASWSGALDDVRVFDVALSPEEILSLAQATTNHAPVVDAGADVTVQLYLPVTLIGTVTDDGLPVPPGLTTNFWTYLGTNDITIPDPLGLTNTFVFTNAGTYVFRLTASDGALTSFADVTVTVIPPTQVDIYADRPDAYELGPQPGGFTLTRDGDTNELTVFLAVSGTASNNVDYVAFTNTVTFAVGSNTVSLEVMPFLDLAIENDESVSVTIVTNIAYSIGSGQATVTIHDSPYGQWSVQRFTLEQLTHPEVSGAAADFDHDGILNFAEYAFNFEPTASNTPPPYQWGFETNTADNLLHLTLTYTRRLPPRDVEYGVYVSTNLVDWNTGTNFVEEFSALTDPNNITETVKTRAVTPYPYPTNLFMNIRVWLQQVPIAPP